MNADRNYIIEKVTEHIDNTLADQIAHGVADAVKLLVKDPEFMAAFWQQGYNQLSLNASTGVKLWIGGKIMWAVIGAAFSGVMLWLNARGTFK